MERLRLGFIAFILVFPLLSEAYPRIGANLSIPLVTHEPTSMHGAQFMLSYDPGYLNIGKINIFFDGGFSYFWVNSRYHHSINIFSVAPIMRFLFYKGNLFSSYFDLSIGLAYLSDTHLEKRNLGMHFTFQDRAGVGLLLGPAQKFSIGVHAVHYSNAHLCSRNSGITVPLALDIGYSFD